MYCKAKKNCSSKKITFEILWSEFWIYADSGPPRYFDAAVVFVTKSSLLLRLAVAVLWSLKLTTPPSFFGFFVTFSSHTLSLNQWLRGQNFWRKTFQGKYSRCFLKTGQEYFRTLWWGTTLIYFCESHSKNSQF